MALGSCVCVRSPWWRKFAEKGLDGAKEAGAHAAKVVSQTPWLKEACFMNFQHVVIEFNEYWAGISSTQTIFAITITGIAKVEGMGP